MCSHPHPRLSLLLCSLFAIAASCGSEAPTGISTSDMQGTWSGTFAQTNLMGRTLSGDVDWTFDRDTFRIVFFNAPEDQAERIEGDWKFSEGKVVVTLKSSFPIETDIGEVDTLFVSILRDEMSINSANLTEAVLLQKTRLGRGGLGIAPWMIASRESANVVAGLNRAACSTAPTPFRKHRAIHVDHTHPPV